MKKATRKIREIMAGVEEHWTADDGGLSMAASDLLSFGQSVIVHIEENDIKWVWELDPFGGKTGQESDIITTAQGWAKRKFRRRIEDRLRKSDFSTLHKIGQLLGMAVDDGWVEIQSSYSGNSIETRFGELTHTNGHFNIAQHSFNFSDIPEEIAHETYADTPASCGHAKFHVQRLETWLKGRI